MAFLVLVFAMWGLVHSSRETPQFETRRSVSQRLERLESLVLRQNAQLAHQDEVNKQMDAKLKELKSQWEADRVKWQLAQESLEAENRVLKADVRRLKMEKLRDTRDVMLPDVGKTRDNTDIQSHSAVARSDDPSPLEPVVTQMAQRLTEVSAEVQALQQADSQQDQAIQEAGSSTFVRWGNSACPNSTQLVYAGVVGGSSAGHTGAATNYLCLSLTPVISTHPLPSSYANLYGAEYESKDSHENKDPVCPVCRSPRPTTVMIPGTNKCVSGWTTEYSGFLMAGYTGHPAGSEYICVDSAFESRIGGDAYQAGKYLYFTATVCGSLPCQPYVNSKLVTCAVCSK